MISCILLSGGSSSRFGSPKALADINGQPVIRLVLRRLLDAPIDDIVVVLGEHLSEIKPFILEHKNVRFVHNKDHILGQTSSFKCGLSAVKADCRWVFLLPVDCPFIAHRTFLEMIEFAYKSGKKIIIPSYKGKKGHPPLLAKPLFEEVLALENGAPLNSFMQKHREDTCILELEDEGILWSFNTPEELEQLKDKFI